MTEEEREQFSDVLTSPARLLSAAFSQRQLAELVGDPRIQRALHDIRANPVQAMLKYEGDAEVMKALDLLQEALGL